MFDTLLLKVSVRHLFSGYFHKLNDLPIIPGVCHTGPATLYRTHGKNLCHIMSLALSVRPPRIAIRTQNI